MLATSEQLVQKLGSIQRSQEHEHGEYRVFALLRREDKQRWDVFAAADWADKDTTQLIRELSSTLSENLSLSELLNIGVVIGMKTDSPVAKSMIQRHINGREPLKVVNEAFDDLEIADGWIMKAN